mgnify:CR=1 FL=1|tara:strand:- start:373 stop:822 length:450 start_codon:yes stop_codon:yes gene_type:complete
MNYFEEVELPKFDRELFYSELIRLKPLMRERYQHAKGWTSIDLVSKSKFQLVLSTCPSVKEWLEKQNFKTVYVAILEAKGYINWHVDQTHEKMSDAINLYIRTNTFSVIEFEGGNIWQPQIGKAYKFRSDIKHRVINAGYEERVMLSLC